MGEPVSIVELAERMIRLHGFIPYFETDSEMTQQNGDICIKFTGLRPGEKLHEELTVGENPVGTIHPRILAADDPVVHTDEFWKLFQELLEACENSDHDKLHKLLQTAPIDYHPAKQKVDLIWEEQQGEDIEPMPILDSNPLKALDSLADMQREASNVIPMVEVNKGS